jgi:hypothetical protein
LQCFIPAIMGTMRPPIYVGPLSSTQRRRLSSRPKSVAPVLDEAKREWLRAIVHESPRSFGQHPSLWTLRLLAEICFEQGVTSRALSSESMRRAFKRMGVAWRRAKRWITSPDPRYALKKAARPVDPLGSGLFGMGTGLRR